MKIKKERNSNGYDIIFDFTKLGGPTITCRRLRYFLGIGGIQFLFIEESKLPVSKLCSKTCARNKKLWIWACYRVLPSILKYLMMHMISKKSALRICLQSSTKILRNEFMAIKNLFLRVFEKVYFYFY